MLGHRQKINQMVAEQVAAALGKLAMVSDGQSSAQPRGTADSVEGAQLLADAKSETTALGGVQQSKELSMENQPTSSKGRKVAILVNADIDAGLLMDTLPESVPANQLEGMGITIGRDDDQSVIDQFVSTVGMRYWKRSALEMVAA